MSKDKAKDDTKVVIPEDLTTLADADLTALHDKAIEVFQGLLPEDGTSPTDDALNALSALAEGIEAVKGEVQTREAAALSRQEKAKGLADRVLSSTTPDPAAVASEDKDDEDEEPKAAKEPEAVPASGKRPNALAARRQIRRRVRPAINIDLGSLSKRAPVAEPEPHVDNTPKAIALAAQGAAGFEVGRDMTLADMAAAINSRLAGFNVASYQQAAARGQRMSERFAIAKFKRQFPEDLVVHSEDPRTALNAATDQSRIPNGLVASGGWCAPSETLYDLIEVSEAADLVSVPEIQINRGGVRHALGPTYSDIYTNSGFCYTEAEDIAGDYDGAGGGSKPFYTVDCPAFTDVRLDYCGVAVSAGLLQSRGYPELIEVTIGAVLNAHMHRVAAAVINKMVAASTAISWGGANTAGATAPLLTAIEMQAVHLRAANRMSENTVLEAVLPTWTKAVIRADLSRRLGVDLLSVSNSRIMGWFGDRNINAQFVVDWQDVAATAATSFTAPPTSVDFLLYPAGTFVKGTTDSITLENIYDSTMLGTNDFTALFTEDPYLVLQRFADARVVTVPVEATGNAHIGSEIKPDGTYTPAV